MLLSSHTKSVFRNHHDFHHLEQVTAQKASYSPCPLADSKKNPHTAHSLVSRDF